MTIGKTTISDLRHRIVLCTMQDVVEANGTMELTRREVVETWARVRPFLTFGSKGSFVGAAGYTILDPKLHQSHWISIRFQHDLDINSTAWVYEARRKGLPRWYKVLGSTETEDHRWTEIAVHLYERAEAAQPVQNDLSPVRSNVAL